MKRAPWGRRMLFPTVVVMLLAALSLPAGATLKLLKPDPAVPATFVGRGGVSTDGLGQSALGGTIQAEVPPGSTVVQAYLYATYVQGTDNPSDADRTIKLDTTDHVLTLLGPDPATNLATARGDVTAQVSAKVGTGHGVTDFAVNSDPSTLDGVALVVIYSNPSLPVTTIAVLDGESLFDGDSFTFDFSTPLETNRPGFSATMAVGSGFSYQGNDGHICGTGSDQASTIDVNDQRVSSCAGGYDDGLGQDGALITVGGVGDSIDNPADPQQMPADGKMPRVTDDELYDLVPFLHNGDAALTVKTANASHNDNLFLAVIKVTQEVGVQKVVPVANPDNANAVSGQPVTINVLANDKDPDHLLVANTVSVPDANKPAHGTAVPDASGTIVYTSTPGYTGTDAFMYQVCGVDQTLCTSAVVSLTVSATAAPPTTTAGPPPAPPAPITPAVPTFTG